MPQPSAQTAAQRQARMLCRRQRLPPVLALWLAAVITHQRVLVSAAPPPNGGPAAAAALAERVFGVGSSRALSFRTLLPAEHPWCDPSVGPCALVQAAPAGADAASAVTAAAPTVEVLGTTPVEMAYGLAQYCQRELHMSFAWERSGGFQVPAGVFNDSHSPPAPPAQPLRLQKRCAPGQGVSGCYTHYGNVVTGSYSWWNWDWRRWEVEVDWMALHGVNLVFAFTGQEFLWRETYRDLGLSDDEIQTSFNGPAFLGWSRSYESAWENGAVFDGDAAVPAGSSSCRRGDGNSEEDGCGGSPGAGAFNVSLKDDFLQGQWELQKQIVARQTELGIGSVLPGFSGKVPGQLKRLFPAANITGDGSAGPAWVEGLDPLFANISRRFLAKAVRDFGRTGFYEADGFFGTHAAPWYFLGGGGAAAAAAATTTEAAEACAYGPEIPNHYVPGEASDNGTLHASLALAQAACGADVFCGGVESRHCNASGAACTEFQTRSGMSSAGCQAGVPCPGDIPKAVPVPPGTELQNAFLITNAPQCGHHPPPPPPAFGWDARAHALAVYNVMKDIDKEAVWVYQGWPWMRTFLPAYGSCDGAEGPNPNGADYMRNFTSAVPPGRLVFLDMRCECASVAAHTSGFYNSSFVWEAMDNFGGGNGMYGDVALVADKLGALSAAVAGGSANATSLAGTGISMEGIDQNPLYYETVLSGLWVTVLDDGETAGGDAQYMLAAPPTPVEFVQDWGTRRCGRPVAAVVKAWGILASTTFRAGQGTSLHHPYCSNFFPSASMSSSWAREVTEPGAFWRGGYTDDADAAAYAKDLFTAWQLLTESADECGTAAARFDVVDVGREWLQTVPCVAALRALGQSWLDGRSQGNVSAAAARVDGVLADLDALLSADAGFSLGAWIAAARRLGATPAGRAQLELNARAQVTSWAVYPHPAQPWSHAPVAPGEFAGINDYAVKQWGGLIREYQAVRLRLLGQQVVDDAAAGSAAVNLTLYVADVKDYVVRWLRREWNATELPDTAVGDPVAISRALQNKYAALV